MRLASLLVLSVGLSAILATNLNADDYIKDGKLTQQLKVKQLQGGFAGFTGFEYTVETDGTWAVVELFNQKGTPKNKGKFTAKQLESLAATLKKFDLEKLPAKSGKEPGANPHTIEITFGKVKANLVGQEPPTVDAKNPTSTVESRFAGIFDSVKDLRKEAAKKDGGK